MGQVESTLRRVNGRLVGNRNWRLSCVYDEEWNFRHITMRRRLVDREVREVTTIINQEEVTARLPLPPAENDDDLSDLDADFYPEDDVDPQPEPQQNSNPDAEPEEYCQQENDDFTDAALGAVTFDTNRTSAPVSSEDRRWDGLQDVLDAMQDVHCNPQEHEIHLDGISSIHYYHAARHGIIAVDRFDLYGDRNPPAWWPILECA